MKLSKVTPELARKLAAAVEACGLMPLQTTEWGRQVYRRERTWVELRTYGRSEKPSEWRTDGYAIMRTPATGAPRRRFSPYDEDHDKTSLGVSAIVGRVVASASEPRSRAADLEVYVGSGERYSMLSVDVPLADAPFDAVRDIPLAGATFDAVRLSALMRWTGADSVRTVCVGPNDGCMDGAAIYRSGVFVGLLMRLENTEGVRSVESVMWSARRRLATKGGSA